MTVLGPYAALSWRFTVRSPPGPLADQVARALQPLASTELRPSSEYVLLPPSGDGRGSLSLDGTSLLESRSEWSLYARLLWHVNVGTVDATTDHVLLHAAAAERDGRAVLLCAPMESGKTTLVAGLVLAGLRYLTDECVALRPADRRITPFPKSLSVDSGSWPVLPMLRPELPSEAQHLVGTQWQVPPTAIRSDAVSRGAAPAVVVLPRYVAGATTAARELSPGTALLEVLRQVFHVERSRRRDMEVLAGVISGCRSYRLTVGDLPSAVATVMQLLEHD